MSGRRKEFVFWRRDRSWWRNLWFDDWKSAFIFFLVLFGAWAYAHDTAEFRAVYEDPCSYCSSCGSSWVPGGGVWVPVGGDLNLSLDESGVGVG